MATVPVLDRIESRSIRQDAATLQFQRLERVRARLGARRRHRLIFATKLVIVASVGVLGFTAIRLTPFERLGSPRALAPVGTLKSLAASPAATKSTPPAATNFMPRPATNSTPPAATDSTFGPPAAIVAPPTRLDRVKLDVPDPPRLRANAKRRGRPLSHGKGRGAAASSRGEEQDVGAGAVDSTAAIDWLLKTSPTRAIGGSQALFPDREEIPQ